MRPCAEQARAKAVAASTFVLVEIALDLLHLVRDMASLPPLVKTISSQFRRASEHLPPDCGCFTICCAGTPAQVKAEGFPKALSTAARITAATSGAIGVLACGQGRCAPWLQNTRSACASRRALQQRPGRVVQDRKRLHEGSLSGSGTGNWAFPHSERSRINAATTVPDRNVSAAIEPIARPNRSAMMPADSAHRAAAMTTSRHS